ncbi:MAG: O-antigen ligase family protein [Clostridia bacterium]|nr:O-antigen ligase family protein [Clostridia bacterium]
MKNSKAAIDRIFVSGSGQTVVSSSLFSRLSDKLTDLGRIAANTGSFAWGLFLMTFGLVTLFSFFTKYYVSAEEIEVLYPLIAGILSTILSIPFLLSRESVHIAFQKSPVCDAFLFDFLCLQRRHIPAGTPKLSVVFMMILGGGLAVVGFFTSPMYVLLAIAAVLLLGASIDSPEAPFILSLVAFPYLHFTAHPSLILAVLILLSFFSYVHKARLGNRLFSLDFGDYVLFLFALCLLLSGIFNGGLNSFLSSLLFVSMLIGCILAKNLLINRRLADLAIGSISVASFPICILGITQYFVGVPMGNWLDSAFSETITTRVYASFGNPNVFAVYLLTAAFCSLALVVEKRENLIRILFALVFAANVVALTLTFSRGAWVAFLVGFIASTVIWFRRRPGHLLVILSLLPYGIFFLSEAVLTRFASILNFSDSSVVYRLSIWRSSVNLFLDNLFVGIGIGESNFTEVFKAYAEEGVTAPHSHNLLLEIGCECGVFALAIFLLLLIERAVSLSRKKPVLGLSGVRKVSLFSHAGICALLIFGLFDYTFADMGMIYLFFVLFGIGGATLRIADTEQESRRAYLEEGQDTNSSDIDVTLK